MTQIPIRGQIGAMTAPPLVVRPCGETLKSIRPFSAMGTAGGGHANREVLAAAGGLEPSIRAQVRKVAAEK
jgi:hypothetical protein